MRQFVQNGFFEGTVITVSMVQGNQTFVAKVDVPFGPLDLGGNGFIVDKGLAHDVDQ